MLTDEVGGTASNKTLSGEMSLLQYSTAATRKPWDSKRARRASSRIRRTLWPSSTSSCMASRKCQRMQALGPPRAKRRASINRSNSCIPPGKPASDSHFLVSAHSWSHFMVTWQHGAKHSRSSFSPNFIASVKASSEPWPQRCFATTAICLASGNSDSWSSVKLAISAWMRWVSVVNPVSSRWVSNASVLPRRSMATRGHLLAKLIVWPKIPCPAPSSTTKSPVKFCKHSDAMDSIWFRCFKALASWNLARVLREITVFRAVLTASFGS